VLPLVDGGRPFGSSASVRDDRPEGAAGDLIGYTFVEADDLAAAVVLTDGLPFLSNGDGNCAVEIFELQPIGQERSAALTTGGAQRSSTGSPPPTGAA
jgi:hypothetical protein